MRPEFNPKTAGQPVSTYELGIGSTQIAFADNGIIAIIDFERTLHLFDKQYHPLHTFTCCDELKSDGFECVVVPMQMIFDAFGNILLAVKLYSSKRHCGLLRFNTNGKQLQEMSVPKAVQGRLEEGRDIFYNVTGVARDPHGNVFFRAIREVSDGSITHFLCKQPIGSGVPTVISDDIFGQDVGDVKVMEAINYYCNQLAYGPNDHLYVVSPDGIQEFDSTSGNKLRTISLDALPIGDDDVHNPQVCFGLTVSGDGYIFVTILGMPDVFVFSQDGSFLNKLSTPSSQAVGGIAIDRDGFLHVGCVADGCVYVF